MRPSSKPRARVKFARPTWRVCWFGGRLSFRAEWRFLLPLVVLAGVGLALATWGITTGSYQVSVGGVVRALFGQPDSALVGRVVKEWRAPRVFGALVLGAALGASGAVFQAITRNPLGSPDIIGFSSGAYTGGIVVLILLRGTFLFTALGATIGGLITAAVVYALTWRSGIKGTRLILIGIGLTAMLAAFNHWLVLKAELDVAMAAASWGSGSLNGMRWSTVGPATFVILLAGLLLARLSRPLLMVELGDDAAAALGVRVLYLQTGVLVVAVVLVAVATAAAGPVSFVALAAPQIARRLTGAAGTTVAGAATSGGVLLLAADLIAGRVAGGVPVGVVTTVVGGGYLVWLLIHEARRTQ